MNTKNRLFFIREYNDFTQKYVAKELGISRSHYSNCELNIYDMRLPILNKFCNLCNTDLDYIFYLKSDKNQTSKNIENIDINVVSKNLDFVMKKNNLTQKQVANYLKCSQSVISKYVTGKSMILTVFAVELAKKFNFSLDWFIGRY